MILTFPLNCASTFFLKLSEYITFTLMPQPPAFNYKKDNQALEMDWANQAALVFFAFIIVFRLSLPSHSALRYVSDEWINNEQS